MGILGDLPAIRAEIEADFLPDQATNHRTSVTTACRVSSPKGHARVRGTPSYIRLPEWRIVVPNGTDLQAADRLTVVGNVNGDYMVFRLQDPTSFTASTQAFAGRVTFSAGFAMPVPPNATVSFYNPQTNQRMTGIPVYLYAAGEDVHIYNLDAAYDWAAIFPPDALYGDGSPIKANHQIEWAQLGTLSGGTPRGAAISKPRPTLGMLPYNTGYFKENA